jgi:3-oxoacyl-[acyl-carrier-protein] synthase II
LTICCLAGFVPRGNGPGQFNEEKVVTKSERRMFAPFTVYALAASEIALNDAGYTRDDVDKMPGNEKERTGVSVGVGMFDLTDVSTNVLGFENEGFKKVSPHFFPKMLINICAGNVAIRFGFLGPNHTVSTGGSTGTHAIANAYRMIRSGDADAMLAGAADSYLTHLEVAAFASAGVLSTKYNDAPERASRPFDQDRDGFVIAEGSAIVFMEEYEKAKERGANIYCEVIGFGMAGDAMDMIHTREDGRGIYNSMVEALKDAKLSPENVSYVSAHAPSSIIGKS